MEAEAVDAAHGLAKAAQAMANRQWPTMAGGRGTERGKALSLVNP